MEGPNDIKDISLHTNHILQTQAQRKAPTKSTETPQHHPAEDSVNLSSTSQKLEAIHKAISDLPDIRADRIAQIRQALDSGTYHVSSQQIADSIVQETIRNSKPFSG